MKGIQNKLKLSGSKPKLEKIDHRVNFVFIIPQDLKKNRIVNQGSYLWWGICCRTRGDTRFRTASTLHRWSCRRLASDSSCKRRRTQGLGWRTQRRWSGRRRSGRKSLQHTIANKFTEGVDQLMKFLSDQDNILV